MPSLVSMRYKGNGNIREYIMKMSNITFKLKALKLGLTDDLLVHLVLISVLAQYSQFTMSYNIQKDKWTLNELISHCVQEEYRIKQKKIENASTASTSKDKKKKKDNIQEVAVGIFLLFLQERWTHREKLFQIYQMVCKEG